MDYPTSHNVAFNQQTFCTISLEEHTTASISILDVGYSSTQDSMCPVRIDIPEQYRCPKPNEQPYPGFTLTAAGYQQGLPFYDVLLTVTPDAYVSAIKLWL